MESVTEMSVLDELARAIDDRGLTRADFAKAVGIGQPYLSQILSGTRPLARIPIGTGRKISEISGIPLERLAAGAVETLHAPIAPDGDVE